ncbi:hypothetical protein HDU86_001368 [Geranomyces michiganensis]|nr:hypothetical protein HDU86_001368 [Geranomyces michiganensis]
MPENDTIAAMMMDADVLESGFAAPPPRRRSSAALGLGLSLSPEKTTATSTTTTTTTTTATSNGRTTAKRRMSALAPRNAILATSDLVGPSSSGDAAIATTVTLQAAANNKIKGMESQQQQSRLFSKHSIRDSVTSTFDSWWKHDMWLGLLLLLGFACGVALATLTHLSSGAFVPSEGWFNGLHIAIGLIAGMMGHWGERVAVSAARTYFASALLGDDGVSLKHVVNTVNGGALSALLGLYGDRQRLRKAKDHASMGRRPMSLQYTASVGAVIGVMMPLIHVILILGSEFHPTSSEVAGFNCDVPDYALSKTTDFGQQAWITGADYFLNEVATDGMSSTAGSETFIAACHDVDGHPELDSFQAAEIVQALRFEVECEEAHLVGAATYTGDNPALVGSTDLLLQVLETTCTAAFCQMHTRLYGYGVNATTRDCVVSTQTGTTTGYAEFKRVGLAGRVCYNFATDAKSMAPPDPNYAALWRQSVQTLNETTARWPKGSWLGGLAFELPMDPPFIGDMPAEYARHIHKRMIGAMHRLLSGNYDYSTQVMCDGKGDVGAGVIRVPGYAHGTGIAFGVVAIFLAIYTFSSERDIQLMVGIRNFRRAISALETPLRFAALLDRTEAMEAFGDMCDVTPEMLEAAAVKLVVAMGGDMDVGGSTGHACISTIENVDVFSPVRMYKGRRRQGGRGGARVTATATAAVLAATAEVSALGPQPQPQPLPQNQHQQHLQPTQQQQQQQRQQSLQPTRQQPQPQPLPLRPYAGLRRRFRLAGKWRRAAMIAQRIGEKGKGRKTSTRNTVITCA